MNPDMTKEDFEYLENEDGSYKVAVPESSAGALASPKVIKESILNYNPQEDKEYLLETFPKNGTHLGWEMMQMLLNGNSNYLQDSKATTMMDLQTLDEINKQFPVPRVLNTHFRLDVLPKGFRELKTVLIMRNPKDTAVSFYFMIRDMMKMAGKPAFTFEQYIDGFLSDTGKYYGSYFKYTEYMWELSRNNPNILALFFEDIKRHPVDAVRKIDEFMGTKRDENLIKEIAAACDFAKMKEGKRASEIKVFTKLFRLDDIEQKTPPTDSKTPPADSKTPPANSKTPPANSKTLPTDVKIPSADSKTPPSTGPPTIFRKGAVGDWKNYFTVAMNEKFDEFLRNWEAGSDIPFTYE